MKSAALQMVFHDVNNCFITETKEALRQGNTKGTTAQYYMDYLRLLTFVNI